MTPATAILIAGPTASGKSAVALALAQRLGGVVINADSMQVYGDLRILTARPTPEEEAQAPHLMFGHVDAAINHSVGRWLRDAQSALAQARQASRVPIFIGGSGLYFKALTQGLSAIPPVPVEVRAEVRARANQMSTADLHAALAARDPRMAARLRPSDPQRILRALEVHQATGQSLLSFQARRGPALLDPRACAAIFLAPDRHVLNERIDLRFDAMLRDGALDEVEVLSRRQLDPALPVMRAHGVPHLVRHINGEIGLDEAAAHGKLDTRRYAKRQLTFARHQLPDFTWVAPDTAKAAALVAWERAGRGL